MHKSDLNSAQEAMQQSYRVETRYPRIAKGYRKIAYGYYLLAGFNTSQAKEFSNAAPNFKQQITASFAKGA